MHDQHRINIWQNPLKVTASRRRASIRRLSPCQPPAQSVHNAKWVRDPSATHPNPSRKPVSARLAAFSPAAITLLLALILLPQFALGPLLNLLLGLLLPHWPLSTRLTLRRRHNPRCLALQRLPPTLCPCLFLSLSLCLSPGNLSAFALRAQLLPLTLVAALINLTPASLIPAPLIPASLVPTTLVPSALVPTTLVTAKLLLVGDAPPDLVGNPATTSQKHLTLRHTRLPEALLLPVPPMPNTATVINPWSNARIIEVVEPAKAAANKPYRHIAKPIWVTIKPVILRIIELLIIIARRAAIGILVHTSAQPKS